MNGSISRRLFLTVAGSSLAPLVSVATAEQTTAQPSLPFPARDFGSLHRGMLERLSDVTRRPLY